MQMKNINQNQSLATISSLESRETTSLTLTSPRNARELDHRAINSCLEVDGNKDKITSVGGSYKLTPPPYRMPPQPLYNEPAPIPGAATPSIQQMHTHSNKFPIEREVILSSYDKNSKIPILNEYHRKHAKSTAIAPDAPNIQVAWTEDRANRTYSEVKNTVASSIPQNVAVEYHRTYKAQPLSLLDNTDGTEPSPITNQDDSNGFTSYAKQSGRSHSTPETEATQLNKPFPSRTYHTIKDMISSRFSKSKTEQSPENLNNCENYETPKTETNLSPHSQLVQRGVYLASSQHQQCNRNIYGSSNGVDITKRNQEIRDHILGHYRERAVDVGQTAGVSQQTAASHDSTMANFQNFYQDSMNGPATPNRQCLNADAPNRFRDHGDISINGPATPNRQCLNADTPNRFRDHGDIKNRNQRADYVQAGNVSRNVKRSQNGVSSDGIMRLNEICEPPNSTSSSIYNRNQTVMHNQRQNEQQEQRKIIHGEIFVTHATPSTGGKVPKKDTTENRVHNNYVSNQKSEDRLQDQCKIQLSNGVKHGMERVGMSRARSNDHLLEANSGKSTYARKESSLKQKSKSFENLGNDINEAVDKIETKSNEPLGGVSSDYEKHRCGGQSDSGRGSTVYSSGKLKRNTDTSPDSSEPHRTAGNKNNQWVDIVENELKHILEPKSNASIANSTLSDSSTSPPLPPVSPDVSSDEITPAYKHKSLLYGNKMEPSYRSSVPSSHMKNVWNVRNNTKEKIHQRLAVSMKKPENSNKVLSTVASSSIDLDSMLDEDNYTSDEDISVSDTRTIRKQLEGLENMYTEVMKLLGVRKSALNRYQPSDSRMNKRRMYGSVSSLPSSVSSRPIRERHRRDDKRKFVRDIKGINKRFQRLESHVVTLARSVAHLSSEMRTQHLMIQEMEVIRNELTNLRAQTNMLTVRSQSMPRFHFPNTEQINSSPDKMKKLTKFFGDEPPLLRLFLKKLGYEKYANAFEKERIGLVELPYMSEERLHKLGIPMGPRLRIIQEAQLGFPGTCENTLCIV